MYPLKPLKVYMLDRVRERPEWLARMRRILDAIGWPEDRVEVITDDAVPAVLAELERLWPPDGVPAGSQPTHTRPLVFTTMDLRDEPRDLKPLLDRGGEGASEGLLKDLFGQYQRTRHTHPRGDDQKRDCVCWPTFDFGVMRGCPHGCMYCNDGKWGKCIVVAVNLEEYMEQVVAPTVEAHREQRCFRMIGWGADLPAFEPEYGLFDLFTRKLAEYDGRYGYFHTAGANVDWIADLPRRDRLIGVWSVTCEGGARRIEPGSPPAAARFEAGRKCIEMGLPVRYKFKPIVPIRNWRQEYAAAIEQALIRPRPESIGFCVLMWMDFETLTKKIDPALLDPSFVAAARDAADELRDDRNGPFPHAVRKEIYRFFIDEVRRRDRDIPLYISTESRQMWDELKGELGQEPRAYVCACSPVAVPGRRLALCDELRYSTYSPEPG